MSASKVLLALLRRAAFVTTAVAFVVAPTAASAVEASAQSGFVFDGWWTSGGGARASQVQIPVSASLRAGDFSAGLLTAYVQTTEEGSDSVTLSSPVDTKLTTSYELVGKLPVDLLLGLDFNLPTGHTDLNRQELALTANQDLLPLTVFGEGYNVNPTLTLGHSWGPVAAGLGVGYLWRGRYDLSSDLGADRYDPGDVANATAEIRWAFLPAWETRLAGSYAYYRSDRIDGEKVRREGDFWGLQLGLRRSGDAWTTSLALSGILRRRGEVVTFTGDLEREPEKSRGPEVRAVLSAERPVGASSRFDASLSGLYVWKNDYPTYSSLYQGSKQKVAASAGFSHRLMEGLDARFDLGGFYLRAAETNYPEPREPTRYLGATARALLTASF